MRLTRLQGIIKGVFIATQLNSTHLNSTSTSSWVELSWRSVCSDTTQLNSTSSCRHVHSVDNCHLSMNVVTQLTQFVGRDVINKKNTTDLAVRCSTGSVELSCVAINTPLQAIRQTDKRQFIWEAQLVNFANKAPRPDNNSPDIHTADANATKILTVSSSEDWKRPPACPQILRRTHS